MANQTPREHLWDLIKDTRFAMFTTRHGSNGHLHASPMTTQNRDNIDADDCLWFFMSRRGGTASDLVGEVEVNVSYANPGSDRYVSVSGRARIVENPGKARELWSKMAEAWFKGPDDPDLALVSVAITHAHYWDVKESKIVQLYEMAKAAMTGKPPTDLGESGEVRMR